ncbi:hypothetical protein C8J57DRAFT_1323001 [Mycena rebaudengoi]|nr:hypothetical protein C8J57DRAFT_1323001 [Mycena rebaudengoi]
MSATKPSKLPSVEKCGLNHEGKSVWPLILSAEKAAIRNAPTSGPKYNDNLIGARVVGFLLLDMYQHPRHSFGLNPYWRLVKEINSCATPINEDPQKDTEAQHTAIYNLGLLYRNHLICFWLDQFAVRSNTGPVLEESAPPSRPSLERVRQEFITKMAQQKEDIKQAKEDVEKDKSKEDKKMDPSTPAAARKESLVRDGFRCVVTGAYDFDSCDRIPELQAARQADNAYRAITQCVHIFSETARGEGKTNYSASAMAILKMFGLDSKVESLVGRNVHNHFNVLTMRIDLHQLFDRLIFWLEEEFGEENTYTICSVNNSVRELPSPPPERVTFKVDPKLEAECLAATTQPPSLPSPSLLAVRAACCRVAHLSGAAEQIDQILCDLEEVSELAEDGLGGSAGLLVSRLLQSPMAVSVAASS